MPVDNSYDYLSLKDKKNFTHQLTVSSIAEK